MQKNVALI